MDRFAAVILAAATAFGQGDPATPRSAELRARREAKSRALEPHQRNRLERLLFRIEDGLLVERLFNPPRGLYLRLGGLGEGAGIGAGPAYRYATDRFDLRVSAAASLKRYAIAEASLLVPAPRRATDADRHSTPYVELYARRRDFPQEDFFGLGPLSLEEHRSNFALRDTFVRASAGLRGGRLSAGVSTGYLKPSVGRGTDKRAPSTDDVFLAASLPGFLERPSFVVVEPFVEFGTVDPPLNPTRGGSMRLAFSRYNDRGSNRFSFDRWDLDVRQYLPLLNRTRTTALRLWLSSTNTSGGQEVPFYLQPTLGGAYSLRGFRTFRFRDRSAALVQAEYRWRVNEFVTGALFYDTGAVAPRLGSLGSLERDYGFGLRAGGRNGVAFRTDVVFGSGQGTRVLVRFDNVF